MNYKNWEAQLIKPCPYLLPCGICDKTEKEPCVQYDVHKIKQEYINNGNDSCENCIYRNKGEHEEPCRTCCHNYINLWRLDETAE